MLDGLSYIEINKIKINLLQVYILEILSSLKKWCMIVLCGENCGSVRFMLVDEYKYFSIYLC